MKGEINKKEIKSEGRSKERISGSQLTMLLMNPMIDARYSSGVKTRPSWKRKRKRVREKRIEKRCSVMAVRGLRRVTCQLERCFVAIYGRNLRCYYSVP